jgi:hypothetical protein
MTIAETSFMVFVFAALLGDPLVSAAAALIFFFAMVKMI